MAMTKLEQHYSQHKEDHRLTTRHGLVEFTVSMKYIHHYIQQLMYSGISSTDKAQFKIADIGAGTGRYSIALAREGFYVTAVELVQHNLDILMSKHEHVKCWPGNAMDLHFLDDDTFDMTILFGPMYHLHTTDEKLKALSEAKRITKKGGVILVGYIMNEYAVLSYCFKERKILECQQKKTLTSDFKTITDSDDLYSFTRLSEMTSLNEGAGLKRILTFAPDGPADYMRRELNALSEEEFEQFIQYQLSVCEREDLLGASSHTVDVLAK